MKSSTCFGVRVDRVGHVVGKIRYAYELGPSSIDGGFTRRQIYRQESNPISILCVLRHAASQAPTARQLFVRKASTGRVDTIAEVGRDRNDSLYSSRTYSQEKKTKNVTFAAITDSSAVDMGRAK